VGAIDDKDARGSFSHYGKQSVDIGAPGVDIFSTVRNNKYDTYSGTSMAAPHVAGAAALVWGNTFSTPAQTRTQMIKVRDLIYENARPVAALKDFWLHPLEFPVEYSISLFYPEAPQMALHRPPKCLDCDSLKIA
jgi:hypothetical protein